MKNLLIPMGGKSNRFPNMRPKWMLTHPKTNNLMCIESIKGINLNFFDNVYFIFLREHDINYNISTGLEKCIIDNFPELKFKFVILNEQTSSQSETVYHTIIKENIEGFIFIKDSDGFFEVNLSNTNNQICYFNLNKVDEISANSKSYITLDSNNIVTNIVEKKVISPYFSVGGYGFNSANNFKKYYERIKNYEGECYISNIIFEMLLDNVKFNGSETENFLDWGTLDTWKKFCGQFSTLFVDIDGTLITNSSEYISPFIGEGTPIKENIEILQKKYETNKVKIILTTSRPSKYKELTINELKKHNIPFNEIIMDLPHSKRIIINDFSTTNGFPTALSINLPRNSSTLNNYIS
jgi:hypothetical protein